MNKEAFKRVGPPLARISSVEVFPTLSNMSIIGTAVGNIIAIMPTVHAEEKTVRLAISSGNEAISSIMDPIWERVTHHDARAIVRSAPTMRYCSGARRKIRGSVNDNLAENFL